MDLEMLGFLQIGICPAIIGRIFSSAGAEATNISAPVLRTARSRLFTIVVWQHEICWPGTIPQPKALLSRKHQSVI